mmetsp:Transcript_9500/g.29288  ORF Transcript_9500/g.29288 Transcript_9500/m.29288 type:complete len:408 (+) Transcript_9500:421-1644(+)
MSLTSASQRPHDALFFGRANRILFPVLGESIVGFFATFGESGTIDGQTKIGRQLGTVDEGPETCDALCKNTRDAVVNGGRENGLAQQLIRVRDRCIRFISPADVRNHIAQQSLHHTSEGCIAIHIHHEGIHVGELPKSRLPHSVIMLVGQKVDERQRNARLLVPETSQHQLVVGESSTLGHIEVLRVLEQSRCESIQTGLVVVDTEKAGLATVHQHVARNRVDALLRGSHERERRRRTRRRNSADSSHHKRDWPLTILGQGERLLGEIQRVTVGTSHRHHREADLGGPREELRHQRVGGIGGAGGSGGPRAEQVCGLSVAVLVGGLIGAQAGVEGCVTEPVLDHADHRTGLGVGDVVKHLGDGVRREHGRVVHRMRGGECIGGEARLLLVDQELIPERPFIVVGQSS